MGMWALKTATTDSSSHSEIYGLGVFSQISEPLTTLFPRLYNGLNNAKVIDFLQRVHEIWYVKLLEMWVLDQKLEISVLSLQSPCLTACSFKNCVTTSVCLAGADFPSASSDLTSPSNRLDNYMVGVLPTIREEKCLHGFCFQCKSVLYRIISSTGSVQGDKRSHLLMNTKCCPFRQGKN